MAAAPMNAGLPPDCHLSAGYVLRLTAIDPATGAFVAGVKLSDISFLVSDLLSSSGPGAGGTPNPLLVPLDNSA